MTDKRRATVDAVLARRQPDLTVLAERLHKPRNFSAIVRTCDAVGINEVHAVPGEEGLAIHWKTSQGAEKWMNVHPHEDLAVSLRSSAETWFPTGRRPPVGTGPDYREIDYTVPTALVVGTELFGVSEEALAESDCQVMIPMKGMTQSLNVSVACAIVLYEAMRQRDQKGRYAERHLDEETYRVQRFEWLHPVVARFCRERGLEYPEIDEDGNVTGSFPRSA